MAYDYLVWGIAAVVVALGLLATVRMRRGQLRSPDQLQTLGITLVVLGIVFGDDQTIGYSFLGAGVLLSVLSLAVRRSRAKA